LTLKGVGSLLQSMQREQREHGDLRTLEGGKGEVNGKTVLSKRPGTVHREGVIVKVNKEKKFKASTEEGGEFTGDLVITGEEN